MVRIPYKNRVKLMIIGGCAAAVAIGGSLAYLTAASSVTNEFTVAQSPNEKVVVEEPNWDPEDAKNIVPTQTVSKDPLMKNESDIPVYAVMQVSVPYARIATANADGTPKAAADMELFSYQVNDSWSEKGTGALSADGTHMVHTYFLNGTLDPKSSSESVFNEVTLVNAVDGQIDGMDLTIDVDGFAIQQEGFTNIEDAWSAYQKQNS